MNEDQYILAIETSCDETAVAVVKNETELMTNVVASQIESHKRFGGVVPEIASRHHIEQMTITLQQALDESGMTIDDMDAIAVTEGPGLVGALLVGVNGGQGRSLLRNKSRSLAYTILPVIFMPIVWKKNFSSHCWLSLSPEGIRSWC